MTAGSVFPFGSLGENTARYNKRKILRTSDSNFKEIDTGTHCNTHAPTRCITRKT